MTHYDAQNGWTVRGKLKASAQGTAAGEAVILDSNAQLPGDLLPIVRVTGTIPASAWSGSGPYTATISLPTVSGTILPTFAPYEPNATQRMAYANARITVTAIDAQNGTVTFTADGTAPTVSLPYMMTGMGGTPSGSWVSSFPGGTGGTPTTIYTLTVTVSPVSSETVSGLTVQITDSQQATATEVTDSNGQAVFTVTDGETYTVQVTSTGTLQEYTTASVTIASATSTATITATAYPTISIDAGAVSAGCAWSIVGTGNNTYSGVLDSNGKFTQTVVPGDTYTVSMTPPSGYDTPASQTVTAPVSGTDYPIAFNVQNLPTLAITVADNSGGTAHSLRALTFSDGTDTYNGTTTSQGVCNITLPHAGEWTVTMSAVSGYFTPASQTITAVTGNSYSMSFAYDKKAVLTVQVTDRSSSGGQNGRTIIVTGTTDVQTGSTNQSGVATFTLEETGAYTISTDIPGTNYVTSATASATGTVNTTPTATLYLDKKPTILVTMTDTSGSAGVSGWIVQATDGTHAATATTDSNGQATIMVPAAGTYTVSCTSSITGCTTDTDSVTVALNDADEPAGITITAAPSGYTFTLNFDSSQFSTDDAGCLTYADDCAGYTPVSGPGATLGACSVIGSWGFNNDGSSSNPMLDGMFYATFIDNGNGLVPYQKLNPNDLTQVIALYDESTRTWTPSSGTSDIATLDTMLCIPTMYKAVTSSSVSLTDDDTGGTALAHTVGSHTYEYLAIGVYGGYVSNSKLMSISGVVSSASITRPNFRSYANTKVVKNGHAMVWNYYQWDLWRLIVLMACKRWNAQAGIGQSGLTYNGAGLMGQTDSMGPWAGDNVASVGENKSVKALIENAWGYKYEFIDDYYEYNGKAYVGQNAVPTDDTSNKTIVIQNSNSSAKSGFAAAILTTLEAWGQADPNNTSGSATAGRCDYHYYAKSTNTTAHLARVGGSSGNVSNGTAGPGCLYASDSLSSSLANCGARLAFVFDL